MGFGARFVPLPGAPPVLKDGVLSDGSAWGNKDTSVPSAGISTSAWPNKDTSVPSAGISTSAWPNRDTGAASPGVSTSVWGSESASAHVTTTVEVA